MPAGSDQVERLPLPRALWVWVTIVAALAVVTWWSGPGWDLPALLYLAGVSVILTVTDLRIRRLPNAIVLPSIPVTAGLLALAAVASGEPTRLLTAYGGGLALFGFYGAVLAISPRAIGGGDVKLAAILGQHLGYYGLDTLSIGGILGVLVGAVALSVTIVTASRDGLKTVVPYGPSMITGAWIVLIPVIG